MSGPNNGNSQTGSQSGAYDSYYNTSTDHYSMDRWLGENSFEGPWNPTTPRDYSHRNGADKSKDGGGKGSGKVSRVKSSAKK
jgi:hypothetical protein